MARPAVDKGHPVGAVNQGEGQNEARKAAVLAAAVVDADILSLSLS